MSKVAVVGGGAGGAAAVVELVAAGHEVRFWSRAAQTLAPFKAQGGVAYDGVLGSGLAQPQLMTCDLVAAIEAAEVILMVRKREALSRTMRPDWGLHPSRRAQCALLRMRGEGGWRG